MRFRDNERLPDHHFADADEWLHAPPDDVPERWQENMFIVAWDLDHGNGVLIHTKRWPAKGDHEAHVVVMVDGEASSAILHHQTVTSSGSAPPIDDEIPELVAEPEQPWSRWRVRAEIDGAAGPGPYGFFAHAPSGPTKGVIDIVLDSDLPPADFDQALAIWAEQLAKRDGQFNSAQHHYEQGGSWHGELRVGDRSVRAAGLFVRDHSWGVRVESNFVPGVFWTASTLDDGRVFCNAIGFPGPDTTVGTGIVVDRTGSYLTTDVSAEFTPAPGLRTYDTTRIRYGFAEPIVLEGRTGVHVPKYLPGSRDRGYDNNAISHVRTGDLTGMGCLEWASVLEPEQAATLDALLVEAPAGPPTGHA
jgi:hypothetical protein